MTSGTGWFGQRSAGFWTVVSGIATVASLILGIVVMKNGGDNAAADQHVTVINPVSSATAEPAPTEPAPTTEAPEEIRLTISDQLTDGVEEETIYVSIEGSRVATLHATRDAPIVTENVDATTAGNYSYVLDAEVLWLDSDGELRRSVASGRGSVYIEDGVRLDVYLHEESDGAITLSLEAAA